MHTAIDLFCGAGGVTVGLKQAGYKVLAAVELDPTAAKAYRLNHPDVSLWEQDVCEVTGPALVNELELARGELDLLAACPPCQGFSRLRTKNGSRRNRDARNQLIFEVLRLARSLRPKAVMLENVPKVATSTHFKSFRYGMEALGYHIVWKVLDAAEYGVPQRRRRLVLLASRLSQPEFARPATKKKTVREAIAHLATPHQSNDRLHNYPVSRSEKVKAIIGKIPKNGGSRSALSKQLDCHKKLKGFWDVYGRMAWDEPAPTITSGCINPSKGRYLHPYQNRAITLREAALLQTFPARYRLPIEAGVYPLALLIGNALPPELIRRQALALRQVFADNGA